MLLQGPDSIGKNYKRVSARKKHEIQFDSVVYTGVLQGDTSGCSPGFVDMKVKVAF